MFSYPFYLFHLFYCLLCSSLILFVFSVLCHKNYAETVTLFTTGGVGVQVINTVCRKCASGISVEGGGKEEIQPTVNIEQATPEAKDTVNHSTLLNFKEIYHMKPTFTKQTYAILRKNTQLLLTYKCCNCCAVFMLIVFIFISYLMNSVINLAPSPSLCPKYVYLFISIVIIFI